MSPPHRQSMTTIAICRQRAKLYEKARQAHPSRWSRATRCWRQPEGVWINKPREEPESTLALHLTKAT
ncbi:hypothetical protein [Synechococcus sp. EJ6-Ellesmere]|uniref:hypothetical protein n=1 Tax=Synechococcus sp. EJ6-Ellesmere TaxID=2823734 RepID=UPI0020CE43D9|nr:hypothetical protein [Synechococcus sp. EJ6-Ellesmere]MCP9826273.1 hypothetical protein [Synechococcus sp. EJ6-Ellesmere]